METLREQNVHENKKALRARCREIVKDLSPEYIEEASHKIADLLLATDAYKNSNTIFCYMSMGGEPVTDEIIERALEDGKRVGIPLCVGPHEMVVKEYKNGDELARGGAGYYDRFLSVSGFNKIALCFEMLLTDDIPLEDTDVHMDGVATEDAIYGTRWRG